METKTADATTEENKTEGSAATEAQVEDADQWTILAGRHDLLLLPPNVGPGELAFAVGSTGQWWDRGVTAVVFGSRLAVIPIAYFLYVVVTNAFPNILAVPVAFAVMTLITTLANEVVFWLVAAFVLGCLLPYLRGSNGVTKGAVLGGVYVGAHAGASLLGASGEILWQVRSLQLVLFLALLGGWSDADTVQKVGLSWHYLLRQYKVDKLQTSITYAVSIIAALVALQQQFQSGQTEKAVSTIVAGQEQWTSLWTSLSTIFGLT